MAKITLILPQVEDPVARENFLRIKMYLETLQGGGSGSPGPTGPQGPQGIQGEPGDTTYVGNIDGGTPGEVYGGSTPIDGGTP